MFWCDYCKVWMNDNPATKATHEAGMKHKDMVARSRSSTMHALCIDTACFMMLLMSKQDKFFCSQTS